MTSMQAKVEYINTQPWSNLFEVSPPQFNVKCQLQKEEFLQLSIISNCNDCIAWKLKTNRPGRYMVSPKQGIIQPKQHKDCTVVLSKLKEIPDTKKPDKFLIQATKITSQTQLADLPQLWKERESKHDKRRGVYAYQSVTIKCFLNIAVKPPKIEEKKQNDIPIQNETPKQNETPVIIEKYYTSDSTAHVQDIDSITITAPTTYVSTPNTTEKNRNNVIESITQEQKSDKSDSITEVKTEPQQVTIEQPTFDPNKVDEWRKKALEYDELFQFTQKLLAQRDELKVLWKGEQEKTRNYMKLNRELKEEKKHILNEYNKYRNRNNEINEENDMENKYDNDDEKREVLDDNDINDRVQSEKERREMIEEFNEIERNAVRNSRSGFTISCVHVMITVMFMYVAFMIGKYNVFDGEYMGRESDMIDDDTVDVTGDKHEI